MFPGSGAVGKWRLTAGDPRRYTVTPDNPDRFGGIAARYVAGADPTGETRNFKVVEGVLSGDESGRPPIFAARETLDLVLALDADAHGHITEILDRKTTCEGLPAGGVRPGDAWTCKERAEWRWTGTGPTVQPAGSSKKTTDLDYRYLEDTDVTRPDGTSVRAAVLESVSEAQTERLTIDPAAPWCPLKVERLKLGHVVGTDRLVAVEAPGSVHLPNRDHGNVTLPRFALMLVLGAVGAIGGALLVAWWAGRRARRRV